MDKLKILVIQDENLFLQDSHDEVFTEFYLSVGDVCFPHIGWTDFTETVLQWWATEIINMRFAINHSTRLYFMDGPYWLDVFKDDKMELKIGCISFRGKKDVAELTVACSYVEFLQALLKAIEQFMDILHTSYQEKQAERYFGPHFAKLRNQIRDIIIEES